MFCSVRLSVFEVRVEMLFELVTRLELDEQCFLEGYSAKAPHRWVLLALTG